MAEQKHNPRAPIAPIVTETEERGEKTITKTHPAFATLSFVVRNGNQAEMFGAKIVPMTTVALKISTAYIKDDGRERVYDDKTIIEVEMSQSQFAEAITSPNRGTGTPVTIRTGPELGAKGAIYPMIAPEDKVVKMKGAGDARVEAEIVKINQAFEVLSALSNADGSVSKTKLKDAVRILGQTLGNLPKNLDYFKGQLREEVDDLVHEAKMELQATAKFYRQDGIMAVGNGSDILAIDGLAEAEGIVDAD